MAVCNHLPEDSVIVPTSLEKLYQEQCLIGIHNFAIGWFTKEWATTMDYYGSKDPSASVAQLLIIIWDGLCEPTWELRNIILHHTPNPTALQEMKNLREKLRWYQQHKHLVLAPRHFSLTSYTQANIQELLERAKKIYEIECKQRVTGQQVLTEYFRLSN